MKLLITGGTGFIGSRLALHCRKRGDTVRVLAQENTDAESSNRIELETSGVELLLGSVADPVAVRRAVDGVDLVFHLAATQHEMNVPDQKFKDVNVMGTQNVLEAAEQADVRRVVHGSTIGVYGKTSGVLDERSPVEPDNVYGFTKLKGEQLALSWHDRISIVAIRIPEVYGPGDRRLLKLFRSIQKRSFFLIGPGRNLHHLIYIDDLVDGLLLAAESPESEGELFVLAGPEAISTEHMARAIAGALDVRGLLLRAPLWPFAVLATVMELMLRPLGVQPPLHRRRLDFFRKSFEFSTEKAQRKFGFSPSVSFDEGARLTAEWYRNRGLL